MEKQSQLLDLAGDFIARVNLEHRIESINRAGRKLLGIAQDHDLMTDPLYVHQFHDTDTWQELEESIFPHVLKEGRWRGKLSFNTTEGQQVPVSVRIQPHYDPQNNICGLTGVGEDLRLHESLKIQQAMAERILDNTIEGIMVTDAGAHIEQVNAAFTKITGYSSKEVIGKTPKFLRSSHHEQSFYDLMNKVLQKKGGWQGEILNRRKSGELYLQRMSISALFTPEGGEITHYIAVFHDLTKMLAKDVDIEKLALRDPLTGFGNRYKLTNTLKYHLMGGQFPRGIKLALLCIDLGRLSLINDRFGMKGGDDFIKHQAELLRQKLGRKLHLYRLSGAEFVALLVDYGSLTEVVRYADKCIKYLQRPVFLDGAKVHMSPSVGIALSPKDTRESDVLMANAQTALLAAKQAGRDCFQLYDETLSCELRNRLSLQQNLKLAIESGGMGLQLYVQPKVNMDRSSISGAEVLLRWLHPERGMISPADFIPLAEESKLIVQLDRWVFKQACELLQTWQQRGILTHWQQQGSPLPILSINLSGRQLQESDVADWCTLTVKQHGLTPDLIELEITETAFINISNYVLDQLNSLKASGFKIALDDFGTGYSNLTYLRYLPVDVVKIDRSLITDITRCDKRETTLLEGVVRLLHDLDFTTIAEGIESDDQAELLRSMGCNIGQGYFYYRPMPIAEFSRLLLELKHVSN